MEGCGVMGVAFVEREPRSNGHRLEDDRSKIKRADRQSPVRPVEADRDIDDARSSKVKAGAHVSAVATGQSTRIQRRDGNGSDDDLKQMMPGRNPKSDVPTGRGGLVSDEDEFEEETEEDAKVQAGAVTDGKTKEMRVAIGEFRASHDRVHDKKKNRVNKAKFRIANAKAKAAANAANGSKHKGRVAMAAGRAGRGAEGVANEGKHGVLNAGRAVGRLFGAKVKPGTSVKKETGPNTTNTAAGAYGAVDTEKIKPTIDVKLIGTTWHPFVTHLRGTYGKITAPLPAGLNEIAGPDAAESRQQIKDLLALDGADWYMVSAVDAHESIHEGHIHDALNNVGQDIATLFAALTVDVSVAKNKKEAIAAIEAMPGYDAIMNLADVNDSQIRDIWDAEYVNQIGQDHYGPTINAEADVVEVMINKINAWRKNKKMKKVKKKWTCTDDGGAVRLPKGRKNP